MPQRVRADRRPARPVPFVPLLLLLPMLVILPWAAAATPAGREGGGAVEIVLPLRDGPYILAELRARPSPDGALQVEGERLVTTLAAILKPEALAMVTARVAGQSFVALDAFDGAGVAIDYDPVGNELRLQVAPEKRAARPISVIGTPAEASPAFAEPSPVSAFANLRSNLDYVSQAPDGQDTGVMAPAGTLDGALRLLGPVIEGEASFSGSAWSRRGTRAVLDLPDITSRLRAGDLFLDRTGFQNAEDVAGVSVSRLYSELAPGRNVRPTGRRTLRLDRPAEVEIFVNNRPMRRLRLQPGTYDLRDFTFFSGDNSIRIIIEDDTGRREVIDYSLFFSRDLLEPGLDEFAAGAGIEAPLTRNQPDYRPGKPIASGFYRRGLSETVTAGVNAQGDSTTRMAGLSGLLATPYGFFSGEVAGSERDGEDFGAALALQWELLNFILGPPGQNAVRTALEARTAHFAAISSDVAGETTNPFIVDLSASYSRDLGPATSASIAGRYAVARGDAGDSYGADLTLSRQIGADWLLSATIGYNRTGGGAGIDAGFLGSGVNGFLSLSWAIDRRSRARATYDSRDNRTSLSYSRYGGQSNGTYSVDAELEQADGDAALTGDVTYYGNRGEIGLAHIASVDDLEGDGMENRTSLRPALSLAYAGGRVALGRPILNSFALVGTAANLGDRTVLVGASRADEEARSDALMPAMVWDLSAYSPRRLAFDVDDLPVGYDLGVGAFELNPPYRAGYDLTVGSAYNVTVIGTLLDGRGEPLALAVGAAQESARSGRSVGIFTNRAGRFVAQGVGPGRWRLHIETATDVAYDLVIPADAVGLFRAGDLRPLARGEGAGAGGGQ